MREFFSKPRRIHIATILEDDVVRIIETLLEKDPKKIKEIGGGETQHGGCLVRKGVNGQKCPFPITVPPNCAKCIDARDTFEAIDLYLRQAFREAGHPTVRVATNQVQSLNMAQKWRSPFFGSFSAVQMGGRMDGLYSLVSNRSDLSQFRPGDK